MARVKSPDRVTDPCEAKLRSFDEATARQEIRNRRCARRASRGWTREELYARTRRVDTDAVPCRFDR